MPPKNAARFPPSARLRRHADFERVYKEGKRHFSASMTVFYLARTDENSESRQQPASSVGQRQASDVPKKVDGLRVGFTVGRAVGGAVQRNRMKRRLREAVRLSGFPRVAADVVINPKKSLLTAEFSGLLNEVSKSFAVIEQKLWPGQSLNVAGSAAGKITELRKPKAEAGKPVRSS